MTELVQFKGGPVHNEIRDMESPGVVIRLPYVKSIEDCAEGKWNAVYRRTVVVYDFVGVTPVPEAEDIK